MFVAIIWIVVAAVFLHSLLKIQSPMAKIIPLFPVTQPIAEVATPLTSLMIKALRLACQKQSNSEPFGQIDIDGSFAGLLRREFIDARTIIFNKQTHVTWYVTTTGKSALVKLGYGDPC